MAASTFGARIETKGFAEMQKLFAMLPPRIEDIVLKEGVQAGARHLAKAARKAAPSYDGKLSSGYRGTAALHQRYGKLKQQIKGYALKKKVKNMRSAIVTRGGAFWGDFVNRGTRYIPATHWFDNAFANAITGVMEIQKKYMVAKITQVSLKAIQESGANKK